MDRATASELASHCQRAGWEARVECEGPRGNTHGPCVVEVRISADGKTITLRQQGDYATYLSERTPPPAPNAGEE